MRRSRYSATPGDPNYHPYPVSESELPVLNIEIVGMGMHTFFPRQNPQIITSGINSKGVSYDQYNNGIVAVQFSRQMPSYFFRASNVTVRNDHIVLNGNLVLDLKKLQNVGGSMREPLNPQDYENTAVVISTPGVGR